MPTSNSYTSMIDNRGNGDVLSNWTYDHQKGIWYHCGGNSPSSSSRNERRRKKKRRPRTFAQELYASSVEPADEPIPVTRQEDLNVCRNERASPVYPSPVDEWRNSVRGVELSYGHAQSPTTSGSSSLNDSQSPATSDGLYASSVLRDSLSSPSYDDDANVVQDERDISDDANLFPPEFGRISAPNSRIRPRRRVSGPRPQVSRAGREPEAASSPTTETIPPYQEFDFARALNSESPESVAELDPEHPPTSPLKGIDQPISPAPQPRSREHGTERGTPRRPQRRQTIQVERPSQYRPPSQLLPRSQSYSRENVTPPRSQRRQTMQVRPTPVSRPPPQVLQGRSSLSAKQRRSSSLGAYLDYKLRQPEPEPVTARNNAPGFGSGYSDVSESICERDWRPRAKVIEMVAQPIGGGGYGQCYDGSQLNTGLPTIRELPMTFENAEEWHNSRNVVPVTLDNQPSLQAYAPQTETTPNYSMPSATTMVNVPSTTTVYDQMQSNYSVPSATPTTNVSSTTAVYDQVQLHPTFIYSSNTQPNSAYTVAPDKTIVAFSTQSLPLTVPTTYSTTVPMGNNVASPLQFNPVSTTVNAIPYTQPIPQLPATSIALPGNTCTSSTATANNPENQTHPTKQPFYKNPLFRKAAKAGAVYAGTAAINTMLTGCPTAQVVSTKTVAKATDKVVGLVDMVRTAAKKDGQAGDPS